MSTRSRPTVAMVGAGQLARMGWQAAISLDLGLVCLGAPGDAAILAGAELLEGSGRDRGALRALAERGDVLSFEHELVDLDAVRALESDGVVVRPSAAVLALAVDKLHQRTTLSREYGLAVPAFAHAPHASAAEAFAAEYGWPVVIKAVSGGYDGRGVWMCQDAGDVAAAFEHAAAGGLSLYAEECVALAGEAAILVARSPSGEIAVYPMVQTRQVDGMCREVVVAAGASGGSDVDRDLPSTAPTPVRLSAGTILAEVTARLEGSEGQALQALLAAGVMKSLDEPLSAEEIALVAAALGRSVEVTALEEDGLSAIAAEAGRIARELARRTELEGLMAVELFIAADGAVLINELALRAHNTGHIFTEAAVTSQFEQHLRAVLGLALGSTRLVVPAAAMVNIVGPADGSDPAGRLDAALEVPGAHVHLYGKAAQPGRKLGHVTVTATTPERALELARAAADRLEGHG